MAFFKFKNLPKICPKFAQTETELPIVLVPASNAHRFHCSSFLSHSWASPLPTRCVMHLPDFILFYFILFFVEPSLTVDDGWILSFPLPCLPGKIKEKLALAAGPSSPRLVHFQTEHCFYVLTTSSLDHSRERVLRWLLSETFEPQCFGTTSFLQEEQEEAEGSEVSQPCRCCSACSRRLTPSLGPNKAQRNLFTLHGRDWSSAQLRYRLVHQCCVHLPCQRSHQHQAHRKEQKVGWIVSFCNGRMRSAPLTSRPPSSALCALVLLSFLAVHHQDLIHSGQAHG